MGNSIPPVVATHIIASGIECSVPAGQPVPTLLRGSLIRSSARQPVTRSSAIGSPHSRPTERHRPRSTGATRSHLSPTAPISASDRSPFARLCMFLRAADANAESQITGPTPFYFRNINVFKLSWLYTVFVMYFLHRKK